MVPTAGVLVGAGGGAVIIQLPGVAQVIVQPFAVVVGIDEFVAGVVGRVDVDHFDAAVIGLLQQLEHFQIVALDDEVFAAVPVDALLRLRTQCGDAGCLHVAKGLALARPGKAVTLNARIDVLAQRGLELVEVDFAFAENLWRSFVQLRQQIATGIGSGEEKFVVVGHGCSSFLFFSAASPSRPPASFSSSSSFGVLALMRFSTTLMCSAAGICSGGVPPIR